MATFINGRAFKQNELLDSGKYKVLRVGNFYTNDSWYYSNLELADKYYIDKGDLVYTWSATFGPHIWNGEKVIYHYHIWKIELSKFLDRDFTLQILEADKAKLLANTNGSTMIHVTKKGMESKVISLPTIEEQKQIGLYLTKFDTLIALYDRKLKLLSQVKKYFLDNLFAEKEYPNLRFKGFTDAWEQRKLENLLKVNSGKNYKQLGEGNIPVYGTSGYMLSVNKSLSENDAIGIGRKGTIDRPQFLKAPFWTVDTLFFLTLKHMNDLNFIYYKFQNINWKKYDESTGVPSLTKNTINKIRISIPQLNEQSKIKQLFTSLDNLIALYENKKQDLIEIKNELLNTMFI